MASLNLDNIVSKVASETLVLDTGTDSPDFMTAGPQGDGNPFCSLLNSPKWWPSTILSQRLLREAQTVDSFSSPSYLLISYLWAMGMFLSSLK